jgi:hypothetical protein
MSNIYNFANRQLCEYASIFPTMVALLDHMLFTIGNGYDIDQASGMIVDGNGKRIDEYPRMTPAKWKKLIESCREKELNFAKQFSSHYNREVDMKRIDEKCKIYKIQNVDAYCFSEERLLSEIVSRDLELKQSRWGEPHYRPYPLSEKYSDIYNLNENTPAWFLQIAINLCNAWVTFLTRAIEADDVCKEKEHDYADMSYTTKHRDMLAARAAELKQLLVAKMVPGETIKIVKRDPLWTYAGCAEPMPGIKGKITKFLDCWKDPLNEGKIAVEFNPRHLGYEDDGENDPVTIFVRPEIVELV